MFSEIIDKLKKKKSVYQLAKHDAIRYMNNSMILDESKTQARLLGLIIARQHVVEKGLTMPETRLGFGKENIISMVELCERYEQKFDTTLEQYQSVIAVLKEYIAYHESHSYQLEDDFLKKILVLTDKHPDIKPSVQIRTTDREFFKDTDAAFPAFAHSRHTVRNYSSEDVPMDTLNKAIELAQTSPSACNRQPVRVHVCCGRKKDEVMKVHKGNRGFGDRSNKVLVVTSNLSSYMNTKERNCAYVDGGIFVMNLLYSLHYYHIGACTLNWSASIDEDDKLRKILSLPKEEEVVCLICIGLLPNKFSVAKSERINKDRIISLHE